MTYYKQSKKRRIASAVIILDVCLLRCFLPVFFKNILKLPDHVNDIRLFEY